MRKAGLTLLQWRRRGRCRRISAQWCVHSVLLHSTSQSCRRLCGASFRRHAAGVGHAHAVVHTLVCACACAYRHGTTCGPTSGCWREPHSSALARAAAASPVRAWPCGTAGVARSTYERHARHDYDSVVRMCAPRRCREVRTAVRIRARHAEPPAGVRRAVVDAISRSSRSTGAGQASELRAVRPTITSNSLIRSWARVSRCNT